LLGGGLRLYGRALRRSGIETHQLMPIQALLFGGLWHQSAPTGIIADCLAIV
jgi:hypothetical protein